MPNKEKFEAVREGQSATDSGKKMEKNRMTAAQLEKAAQNSKSTQENPKKEEIRKAEPVNSSSKIPANYDRWAGPSPINEVDV
mgnify:FL=1